MFAIIILIHIIACIGLIFFILIQSGKGGGLIDSFSSAESIFGTKTNTFLTKITTALAITFFITCLLLAFLSVQQNKSIVERQAKRLPKPNTQTSNTLQPPIEQNQQPEAKVIDQTQGTDVPPEAIPATN
jgi:preprotein translocase subunit SecG